MAKSRRKPSAAQQDKVAIEAAKILKKKGIISKQAKLHGGRFISRSVLAKSRELRHLAFTQMGHAPAYVAVKATKEQASRAREEGYQVVRGNRIVVPKEHDMIRRIRRGELAGLVPVKGGFKSEITLPLTADTSEDIMRYLQTGDLEKHKLEHEMFMFTFHGSTSRRAFNSTEQMRLYLEHYKQDELMKALKIFRLHPEDQIKLIDIERVSKERGNSRNRGRQDARGNPIKRTSQYRQRMNRLSQTAPKKYEMLKAKERAKYAARMERLKANPAKHKKHLEASRARALAHYHANKKLKK